MSVVGTSFGTNISATKKRVKFYNRSSSAVTIYQGMPVCYMFDTTNNILGYDKGAGGEPNSQSTPNTTAEGYQNEGKFMIVELPYSDNLLWFAGVTTLEDAGKSIAAYSYEWLDIFEANGAIVPVRASVACTTGITVLSIESDSQELTQPLSANQARPVAIAEETRALSDHTGGSITAFADYSGTVAGTVSATSATHGLSSGTTAGVKITGTASYNGVYTVTYIDANTFYFTKTFVATETGTWGANKDIVLARLCPNEFIYQDHTGTALSVASVGSSDIVVNRINLTTAQTAGKFTAFEIKAAITSTASSQSGGCGYGLAFYTETNISGILSGSQNASVSHWTNLAEGADLTSQFFGMEIGIYEDGADLSGCGFFAPLCLRMQIDGTDGPTAKRQYQMYLRSDGGGSHPDGLFAAYTVGSIGMVTESSAAVSHVIPIEIEHGGGAGTYYIMVSDAA